MSTNRGAIVVELDVPSAPEAVNIFLAQAGGGTAFYTNTFFHRLQAGVSITGGLYQFTANSAVLKANTRTPVRLESDNGLKNVRGTIALLPDPAGSLTARSRFLINLRDNPENDRVSDAQPGAAVFGRVVSGLEFAEAIGNDPVLAVFFEPINVVTPVPISSILQSR